MTTRKTTVGIFFTPSCNKDVRKVSRLFSLKKVEHAHTKLAKVFKVEKTGLEKFRHRLCDCCNDWYIHIENNEAIECECGCHYNGDPESDRPLVYCFDPLFKEQDYQKRTNEMKIFFKNTFGLDLVCPGCTINGNLFWIRETKDDEKTILKELKAFVV